MLFESLTAIGHLLVCHVSGELTSGNFASNYFSLEKALCRLGPLSTARTAGVIAVSQQCDAILSTANLSVIFIFTPAPPFFSS